ncbi:MAG: RluA family pseudouridine synthase [Endomicrobium sp.]|jgi:23S rRNA pseudouridine1911/1915/1917 synthase|nr:RluA family pseudouridine synthase [Endomicrobium sp.]
MQEKIIYKKIENVRVDSYLASKYKKYSRSYIQKLISRQRVLVNDRVVNSNRKLKYDDVVKIEFGKEKELQIDSSKIELDIVYEDVDIIVVNKRSGIVVHPSCGHLSGTLFDALVERSGGKYTPYLVHRLDKCTSGIIIFAKNEESKLSISWQFRKRVVKKIYYAIVKGTIVENYGIIKAPIGRSPQNRKLMSVNFFAKKIAVTKFKVIGRGDDYTLIEVRIFTGRTHQIRVHMNYINRPIIGDRQYGGYEKIEGKIYNRPLLHAHSITFIHPKTYKTIGFTVELPSDMKEIFKKYSEKFYFLICFVPSCFFSIAL